MTDFISDLERELLAAAQRRAEPGHRRRRRTLPHFHLGIGPIAVTAALVLVALAAFAAVRGIDGGRPADERDLTPPTGGAQVQVLAAVPAAACAGADPEAVEAVPDGARSLGVVARPPSKAGEALPEVDGANSLTWLPAEQVYPKGAREPGPDFFPQELHVIPVGGLIAGCDAVTGDNGADGVCLTVGSGDVVLRCFSDATIERGQALALTGNGSLHGIVPDGVERVRIEYDGGTARAEVVDNVYTVRADDVRAGDRLTVAFERAADQRACAPSAEMLAAVPLLRDDPNGEPPANVTHLMEQFGVGDEGREQARMVRGGDGLTLWVVPSLRCAGADADCVLLLADDGTQVAFACHEVEDIRSRGAWTAFPVDGRLGVAGFAPAGTAGTATVTREGQEPVDVEIQDRVFGTVLPGGYDGSVPVRERVDVRFLDGPPLLVLNGTETDGLAEALADRIPGRETTALTSEVGFSKAQNVERTVVYFASEDNRARAEQVAATLRIDVVEPMPGPIDDAGVVVVAGPDALELREDQVGLLGATGQTAQELSDRILPGSRLAAAGGDIPGPSAVEYMPGWGQAAHEVADRLGIAVVESPSASLPQLGTPVLVMVGDDLSGG